jgi:hypothetical protein
MKKDFPRISENYYRNIFFAFLITLAAGAALVSAIGPITRTLDAGTAKRSTSFAEDGINAEFRKLSQEVRELAASKVISFYLEKGDREKLLAYSVEEARRRGLDGLLITDKDGMVLSRASLAMRQGDYVSQTTGWGRALTMGEKVASIEATTNGGTSLIAGEPLFNNGEQIGGVAVGYALNDARAKNFRDTYFGAGNEIVFANREGSALGSSFENGTIPVSLQSYFKTEGPRENTAPMQIRIKDKYYVVSALTLHGLADESGKLFILTPNPVPANALLFAVLLALIFLVSEVFIHRASKGARRERSHIILIVALTLSIYFASTALLVAVMDRQASVALTPEYSMYNSTISFQPDANLVRENTEQVISIETKSGGEAVNVVSAEVLFDPRKAEILEISTARSFCEKEFFLERDIDNGAGRAQITCVLPSPGFAGDGVLADLIIRPLSIGTFSLTFGTSTQVLANDGLGTSVLRDQTNGSYRVAPLDFSSSSEFVLYSPSHPNSERWYDNNILSFVWPSASRDTTFFYALSDAPLSPVELKARGARTSLSEATTTAPQDGIFFFNLLKEGAKTPATYLVRIDTTPPEAPRIKASTSVPRPNEVVRFEFGTRDDGSGLQRGYYVKIDGGLYLPVGERLFTSFARPGTHTVVIRAFDKANNWSESEMTIEVK